eukprot:TRINITY_DN19068_c0_g1_i1.p1 TRINITY_DN19068_c0_g1~~TRINITY_DN19068_c0_g1_i1.p1  ORF type:complete len:440 (-),score=90.55 TRINITY_DN19068_c0_g1_i1:96-1415(-)
MSDQFFCYLYWNVTRWALLVLSLLSVVVTRQSNIYESYNLARCDLCILDARDHPSLYFEFERCQIYDLVDNTRTLPNLLYQANPLTPKVWDLVFWQGSSHMTSCVFVFLLALMLFLLVRTYSIWQVWMERAQPHVEPFLSIQTQFDGYEPSPRSTSVSPSAVSPASSSPSSPLSPSSTHHTRFFSNASTPSLPLSSSPSSHSASPTQLTNANRFPSNSTTSAPAASLPSPSSTSPAHLTNTNRIFSSASASSLPSPSSTSSTISFASMIPATPISASALEPDNEELIDSHHISEGTYRFWNSVLLCNIFCSLLYLRATLTTYGLTRSSPSSPCYITTYSITWHWIWLVLLVGALLLWHLKFLCGLCRRSWSVSLQTVWSGMVGALTLIVFLNVIWMMCVGEPMAGLFALFAVLAIVEPLCINKQWRYEAARCGWSRYLP